MSHETTPQSDLRVAKRDGSIEPFLTCKLLQCIRHGLDATGETADLDAATARGLGEAVCEYLHSTYKGPAIPARQLIDLVELVLTQTGHSGAAMAIRHHSCFRDKQRRMVMVAAPRANDGRLIQRKWDKALLVQHLRRQHELDVPVARLIAGRVEQLVFNCGLRVVTAALVSEMVKSELLAWGLLAGALVVKHSRRHRNKGKVRDHPDPA
jgi:hypothetical protein